MKYNFESYLNRRETGSSKWLNMDNRNPNVSKEIVPMSVADMEFVTCPEISESLCEYVQTETLGYSKPVNSYLKAVTNFFKSYHGYDAKEEWIVTTPGIVSALATAVSTFSSEGDEVIIFTPVYHPFFEVVEGQNRKVSECPLIYKDNDYSIDFELLNKLAASPKVKMILLCSPHNPGGKVWSREELEKISEIVIKNNILIVSDEIHSDIIYDGSKQIILGSLNDEIGKRAIVCTAASKTFNIAGLQCSNIFIENEELRNKFVQSNNNIGLERANVLGLVATRAAYEKGLDWLKEAKSVIENNNNVVKEFFESYEGKFKVMVPEASFLVWVNFENTGIDHEEFMKFLDMDCEFLVNDGLSFGDKGRNFIRINTGLPLSKLEENLNRLKDRLKAQYNI